ncbi:O-antigen ligase domain-containing protein [Gordonia amarae]|nr:O-antigen ligase domain-containing protein [Gordonia amarae]MCS3877584.1 hypothetical protein [Gordonia amarae]QHN16302.1 O-antigen ligase domain-containing protein [Gordonia amarae]QHN20871.1 O-antigen ligase domain-containing protein [Gordonia amarae]QHN29722.1 O-antigen ligase domain-containing protein [Gordonia amarae]QHN38497.1 O-antigen ligase domain-containing protein [Gordonia amarae]
MAAMTVRPAPVRGGNQTGAPAPPRIRRVRVGSVPAAAPLLAAVAAGLLAGMPDPRGALAAVAVPILAAAVVVVVFAPRIIYGTTAFMLGAAPVMVVPGVPLPFVLAMVFAVWGTVWFHGPARNRVSGTEIAVAALIVASTAGLVMTADGPEHILEYVKWVLATSLVFALIRLPRPDLRLFGRTFVYGGATGTALALALLAFDKSGTFLNKLSPIGYGNTGTIGTHLRFYESSMGSVVRLTGTYVDPNIAGIIIFVAAIAAIAMFRGAPRLLLASILLAGLVMTLSRAAIFSFVLAVVVLAAFGAMSPRLRAAIAGGAVTAAVAAAGVPSIAERIFSSFSSDDKGSADRSAAIADYTSTMTGRWWFGHGFGAPEFTDEVIGFHTNYVANSPLLTIYRGGLLAGAAFVAILVVGAVTAYRALRRPPWEAGVIGAGFIGFAVVALQLDFPVVTNPPVTMAFSVLVALLITDPFEADHQPFEQKDHPDES